MPFYVFEQANAYPLTFAVKEHSKTLSISFAKLDPKHIFFSLAISFKRIFYCTDYFTTNVTINSRFLFYNRFEIDSSENSTLSDLPIEFSQNRTRSPLYLIYIKQGINFSNFDAEFDIISDNFSGIIMSKITCFTMNANTWNFTSLFRLGLFFVTSYFLLGVLLCYNDNNDYPLHKELVFLLIFGFFGVNVFQRFASREFLWFRYSYLMSTLFYTYYRLYMLKLIFFIKGNDITFKFQDTLKWIGYISLILIEIIEIFDVETHSSNSYWLYNPNNFKSNYDKIIIGLNFYYCVFMTFILFKIYLYAKISADDTKKIIYLVFGFFIFFSIVFNFYVECKFGLVNQLRKTTARFFIEYINAYLVIFALSFIHNTRCIAFPKFD